MYKFIHPGTVKQGYLVKSPPLEKRFNGVREFIGSRHIDLYTAKQVPLHGLQIIVKLHNFAVKSCLYACSEFDFIYVYKYSDKLEDCMSINIHADRQTHI